MVLKYEAPSDLAQLIDCLNSGLPPMPWRLSQMRRIIDVAAPAPAASAPESYVATLLRDADT